MNYIRQAINMLRGDEDYSLSVPGVMECVKCGGWDNLQVHHKNGNHKDNRPENLQWLCINCHSREHKRFIPERNDSDLRFDFHKEHKKDLDFRFR